MSGKIPYVLPNLILDLCLPTDFTLGKLVSLGSTGHGKAIRCMEHISVHFVWTNSLMFAFNLLKDILKLNLPLNLFDCITQTYLMLNYLIDARQFPELKLDKIFKTSFYNS